MAKNYLKAYGVYKRQAGGPMEAAPAEAPMGEGAVEAGPPAPGGGGSPEEMLQQAVMAYAQAPSCESAMALADMLLQLMGASQGGAPAGPEGAPAGPEGAPAMARGGRLPGYLKAAKGAKLDPKEKLKYGGKGKVDKAEMMKKNKEKAKDQKKGR